MQGDFSRNTFDPTKHFSGVLMQQGRVQLDADWNELQAILVHRLRTLARDFFGPYGGAKDPILKDDDPRIFNFNIKRVEGADDFEIGAGRFYVDGQLCENEGDWDSNGQPIKPTYRTQKYYPIADALPTGPFLVYLDVWERCVSASQDADIREKALGGPDTAARTQVVWQVRVWGTDAQFMGDDDWYKNKWLPVVDIWEPSNRGRLKVKVDTDTAAYKDPCIQSPNAGYRGAENQLYRIEVHTGGGLGQATFKWSHENGSVVASWLGIEGSNLIVDNARGFQPLQSGQPYPWVELIDDTHELTGRSGILVKVTNVEADQITFDPNTAKGPISLAAFPKNPRVRRWDQQERDDLTLSAQDGAIPIVEDDAQTGWIMLEDGVLIQFQKPPASAVNTYRTGDYWVVPARVATGDVEWPELEIDGKRTPKAMRPHGIDHVYAPLAWFENVVGSTPRDLRASGKDQP